jgi:DegV family protein with EDD domain
MKKYVIVTDATADLTKSILDEFGIKVIPMTYEIADKSYVYQPDDKDDNIHEFYNRLRKGEKSVTSLINTEAFIDYFEPIIKEGYDILYISFSSALSGTYNAALLAIEELMEKYKDSKIIAVDSKAASIGEGLLVYRAAKQKEAGMTIDELHDWILKNYLNICHWFTVDDLNHLKRGGRVSAISATIGTALSVKPVLHVDNEGRLIPMANVRGRKKSLYALLDHMVETCTYPEEQVVFIGHGDTKEDAEFLAQLIRERFHVKEIIINHIGPVIGTHSGPGTIALFFIGSHR